MRSSDRALLLDLYELTMASSYLARDMTAPATFDLFVRHLPPARNFLVACGVEAALEHLEQLRFDELAIERLRRLHVFDERFLARLPSLRFTGDVWAVPEGEVVFGEEPILRVTAPLPEAQLVETFLLNCVLFETMIASKAARVTIAAHGRPFVEFGMRRAQGGDAALRGARAAYVGGAAGTSNVLASTELAIAPSGTMAHSFVMAFPDELSAFRAYATDHGERTVLLIDTWDTLAGAAAAIEAGREAAARGHRIRGVRIDSGDFLSDSRHVRRMLDDAGLGDASIFVSGDLDEHAIAALLAAGAPIDAFGVGTHLATSSDAPFLGGVYKLAEHAGQPTMKLSAGKVTLPGRKQVQRVVRGGSWERDVIALEDERIEGGRPLLERVMRAGRRTRPREPLQKARERCLARLSEMPAPLRDLTARVPYPVDHSPGLARLLGELTARLREHHGRSGENPPG